MCNVCSETRIGLMPVEVHAEALSRRYVVSCCSFAAALHFLLLVATALLPLLAAFASGRETDHRAGTYRASSACVTCTPLPARRFLAAGVRSQRDAARRLHRPDCAAAVGLPRRKRAAGGAGARRRSLVALLAALACRSPARTPSADAACVDVFTQCQHYLGRRIARVGAAGAFAAPETQAGASACASSPPRHRRRLHARRQFNASDTRQDMYFNVSTPLAAGEVVTSAAVVVFLDVSFAVRPRRGCRLQASRPLSSRRGRSIVHAAAPTLAGAA